MQIPIDAKTDAKNGRSKNLGIKGTICQSATKYKTNTKTKAKGTLDYVPAEARPLPCL